MTIEFSPHAKKMIQVRGIDEADVIITLKNPDKILFDEETGNFIAIKKIDNKILIVAYTMIGKIVRVVSAFLTSKTDIVDRRVRRGRWRLI